MLRGRFCQLVDLQTGLLGPPRSSFRECLHQRVREADFGPVHGAIAGCFDEGEDFGVMGVTDEPIDSMLRSDGISTVRGIAHWARCVPLTSPSSLSATKRTGRGDAVACLGQGDRGE